MARASRSRYIVVTFVLAVIVLGTGVATYLLGGSPAGEESSAVLAPQATADFEDVRLLLHLDRGPEDQGVTAYEDTDFLSVESVFVSDEYVFVADRVSGYAGSRVRWFDLEGGLRGSYSAPLGSTLFAPTDGGFSYVIAKSGGDGESETAVLVSVGDGLETAYKIPLQVNSGAVWETHDAVYARIDVSEVDPETYHTTMTSRLVPVARAGAQLGDEDASTGTFDGWGFGLDGTAYTRAYSIAAGEVGTHDQTVGVPDDGFSLSVPTAGQLIGADESGNIYLYVADEHDEVPVPSDAARTTSEDSMALVLVSDATGQRQARLPVQRCRALPRLSEPVSLTSAGLVVVSC
ncbi:MAG: hypothetical protein OEV43_09680, partial [Coriobacteriia bacterium]|nr:hypothetical protein [Coriobacteriia bacterium]